MHTLHAGCLKQQDNKINHYVKYTWKISLKNIHDELRVPPKLSENKFN